MKQCICSEWLRHKLLKVGLVSQRIARARFNKIGNILFLLFSSGSFGAATESYVACGLKLREINMVDRIPAAIILWVHVGFVTGWQYYSY